MFFNNFCNYYILTTEMFVSFLLNPGNTMIALIVVDFCVVSIAITSYMLNSSFLCNNGQYFLPLNTYPIHSVESL